MLVGLICTKITTTLYKDLHSLVTSLVISITIATVYSIR